MPMTKAVKIEIQIPSCQPSQPPIVIPKRFRRRLMTIIPSYGGTTSPLDGWLCFEGSGSRANDVVLMLGTLFVRIFLGGVLPIWISLETGSPEFDLGEPSHTVTTGWEPR